MFGDPKQRESLALCARRGAHAYRGSVPPYGKETAPEMKTIYDFRQLKASAYFLNTQYRMPVPLGEFISEYVYDKKLLSEHSITDRSAVRFVDVRKGREERVGSSWKVSERVEPSTGPVSLSPDSCRIQRRRG